MTSRRPLILDWIESGDIPPGRIDAALAAGEVLPTAGQWRQFLDRLLLFCGVLSLAAAAIFLLAYNWHALGRFPRFGLVEMLIALALFGYWRLGPARLPGKAMLLLAAALLGALLALYGQTYQTGADTWQLFASWALLMLPWALVGRFAALWIAWIALLNTALLFHFAAFRGLAGYLFSDEVPLLLACLLNSAALAAWELGARRRAWLAGRWGPRLLALAGGSAITVLMLRAVLDWHHGSGLALLLYPLWLAGIYGFYRHRLPDLFMLAGCCLSLILVITGALSRILLQHANVPGFFLIALAVIVMSAGAAGWLRDIQREQAR
jgi:uncharacterized membrane protein